MENEPNLTNSESEELVKSQPLEYEELIEEANAYIDLDTKPDLLNKLTVAANKRWHEILYGESTEEEADRVRLQPVSLAFGTETDPNFVFVERLYVYLPDRKIPARKIAEWLLSYLEFQVRYFRHLDLTDGTADFFLTFSAIKNNINEQLVRQPFEIKRLSPPSPESKDESSYFNSRTLDFVSQLLSNTESALRRYERERLTYPFPAMAPDALPRPAGPSKEAIQDLPRTSAENPSPDQDSDLTS